MKTFRILFLAFITAQAYGANEVPVNLAGADDQAPEVGEQNYTMFDLMKLVYSPDEIITTEEDAFKYSSVVVRGYIDVITEGRSIIDNETQTKTPQNTALIKVEVSEVIKGDAEKYVYFEYMRGGFPAETLEAAKYTGEVVLYLRDSFDYPDTFEIVESSRGLMHEVDKLYLLTSTSLFFVLNEKLGSDLIKRAPFDTMPSNDSINDPDAAPGIPLLESK